MLSQRAYKQAEGRIGEGIKQMARNSCSEWLVEENRLLSNGQDLAISYDVGW